MRPCPNLVMCDRCGRTKHKDKLVGKFTYRVIDLIEPSEVPICELRSQTRARYEEQEGKFCKACCREIIAGCMMNASKDKKTKALEEYAEALKREGIEPGPPTADEWTDDGGSDYESSGTCDYRSVAAQAALQDTGER